MDPISAANARLLWYATMGELVISWNSCDVCLGEMVRGLSGGGTAANLVLTAHLSTRAMTDAISALLHEATDDVMAEHVSHFAEMLDRLREYRNFYVHALTIDTDFDNWKFPLASLSQLVSRPRLKSHQDLILVDRLQDVTRQVVALRAYGEAIVAIYFVRPLYGDPPPLPVKPVFPERFKKPEGFPISFRRPSLG